MVSAAILVALNFVFALAGSERGTVNERHLAPIEINGAISVVRRNQGG